MESRPVYCRIYLISGDASYASFIRGLFERSAPEDHIRVESSIPTALEFLKPDATDIILFDVTVAPEAERLNVFLGFRLRARGIPIVVVTAGEDEELVMNLIGSGAQDVHPKTNKNKKDILRVIFHTLRRAKAHEEYCENLLMDELTSLNNRKGFVSLSEQQLSLMKRSNKGLLFFSFKVTNLNKINRDFDYREGNRVLTQSAELLRASFRKTDILARFTGDEFALCAIDAMDNNIALIAERFISNLKIFNDNMPDNYKIQIRTGATAVLPDNTLSIGGILKLAGESILKK